jgi:hypothetical protein
MAGWPSEALDAVNDATGQQRAANQDSRRVSNITSLPAHPQRS